MRVPRMAVAVRVIVYRSVCVIVHRDILPDKWMELLWQNQNEDLTLMSPNLYIIAGPNGAGKTTFATEFLPNYAVCRNFINADMIAKGVAPFSPESIAFRAGRLMLEEIDLYAKRNEDFGFETTLSGRSYLRLIRRIKKRGYKVHFFFLSVPTVELALDRIRDRVLDGGHDIPERVVRRRFHRSVQNFLAYYRPLGDSWVLFDNSRTTPAVVAFDKQGESRIINQAYYDALTSRYETA
jgi:predicted ABC-type ATPase